MFLSLGTSTVASKYEELECLYAAVGKVIYEGLTNYEKATSNTNPTQLFGKMLTSSALPFFPYKFHFTPLYSISLTLLPVFFIFFYFTLPHFSYKTMLPFSYFEQLSQRVGR